MKKTLPYIFIILFPYCIGLLICSLFNQSLMKYLFHDNFYLGLLYLCAFWLIAFISSMILCINNLVRRRDAIDLARTNMIVKLIQIPAYLFIFVAGLMCMLTIFTIAISFVLMFLDGASIILSGLVGVSAVKRNHAEGILSGKEMVLHGILQFIFCADIASSIIVFRKAKVRGSVSGSAGNSKRR